MPAAPQAAPGGPSTVTIDLTPGAITLTSAQGAKQCESIGECLQTLLEMYEQAGGGEEGESALESGYADQAPQESRAIGGVPVK